MHHRLIFRYWILYSIHGAFGAAEERDMGVFFVLGALFLCWLAARLFFEWPFWWRARLSAIGTVVGHREISGEGGNSTLLVISFEAEDGRTIEMTGSVGPWSHEIRTGSTIGVEYPVGLPKRARLMGSRSSLLKFSDLILGFLALAMLAALAVSFNCRHC